MLTQVTSALALLAFAALLAGFAAAVRALSHVDRRPRPVLLAVGAGAGLAASGLWLAPTVLGSGVFPSDYSTLTLLAASGLVAGVDLVEAGRSVRLAVRARNRRLGLEARLERAESLIAGADLRGAAVALHEALEDARTIQDPELAWRALLQAAVMDSDLDRLAMARRHLAEAATIAQERLGSQHLASVFAELAWVAYLGGDPDLAGVCLAWAGRAAGKFDPDGQFAATTTLLAGYLGLANGELGGAEQAFAAVPALPGDPDLEAGLLLGRVCLAYLQGWSDSARDAFRKAHLKLGQARWRSRVVLPLIALSLEARRQERTEEARLFAGTAAGLAVKGGTMAALALYCSDPGNDTAKSNRAVELTRLLRGARETARA